MKRLLIAMALFFSSCHMNGSLPTAINSVRPPVKDIRVEDVQVNRENYKTALKNIDLLSRMRVVPIASRADEAAPAPEYRLFNVYEGSPAALLGLRNADVLVAASGFIIYEPAKFRGFLYLLQNEKTAEIEIRRDGEPILLKYTFI